MELNENTLSVLKNFSGINQNMLIREGNTIKTISEARNVIATAVVEAEFPQAFGIYDLNEFLGVIGLVGEPRLTFEESYVTITDSSNRSRVKYFFSDPEMLTSPGKDINMPDAEVKFSLDTDTLGKVKRAAAALGHDEISISPTTGAIRLSVIDSKDATSNAFSIDVEGTYPEGVDFNFIMNVSNLKVVNEDFEVGISSKLISQFTSKQSAIEYFIALEKSSTYGA